MEGRFLQAADMAGLRLESSQAAVGGASAVFLDEGNLGDPVVLAAGLATLIPDLLLGVRVELGSDGRHPAMLARELTSLDLVCGGRTVLCFAPPWTEALAEAVTLCRALWRPGGVSSEGPCFPVQAAVDRARPAGEESPLIAFDLTAGDALPSFLVGLADLVLRPIPERPGDCSLERV